MSKLPNASRSPKHSSLLGIVIFCGLLISLSGFSTDVVLPAVVPIAQFFDVSVEWPQSLVPAFAIGFGLSQMFYGPASDKYGRRPVIAAGLGLLLVGCLLAVTAINMEMLLISRTVQGLGAGAAPVVARAILRDTHSGEALAQALAGTFAIFGVGIIIAPLLGFGLIWLWGWQACFWIVGLIALLLILFNIIRFKETNASPNPEALQFDRMGGAIKQVFTNSQSRYFIMVAALSYCALFSFISNAPSLYKTSFEIEGFDFSLYFAITGCGIIIGQFANKALLPRLGVLNVLKLAGAILLSAAVGMFLLAQSDNSSVVAFTLVMIWFNTSFLVIVSNCATLALDPHPQIAGLTSSVFGMSTNLCGSLFMIFNIPFVGGKMEIWATIMLAITALNLTLLLFAKSSRVKLHL